jgi:hypothetical protein
MNSLIVAVGATSLFLFALWVGAAATVAYQARQRGYSLILWFVAPLVIVNPVIFLVLLALIPNRKRMKLRTQFRNEHREKLDGFTPLFPSAPSELSAGTGTTRTVYRSLGDMPTQMPPERSLGDEVTRG